MTYRRGGQPFETMQVNLTPELDRMVGEKVSAENESDMDRLRREARLGFEQLEAGEVLELTREEFVAKIHEHRHP